MNDPMTVANKQNCWTIDYAQINALYKDFVPQKELSAEQKYFPSSFIPSDKNSNATPSIPTSMPNVQRCEKQSVDFELKLQHEKEKHKWDSSFKNKNTNPLDYSWISKMEKLEDENVSLDFTVQSLIKERDNVKLEYQKLFNSIKKTRSQTQTEMDELIAHVSEKTYAYGAIRAENQNLLITIYELKTRLANVEKGKSVNTKFDKTNGMNAASSVRRPMNKDSHVKNSVLANSKKPAKKVAVYVRKNKQTDNTFENVISNKENVIDDDVANASQAKTLLCVSCMQNVLIPCHDKCLANYKLNILSTKSRTPKSSDTNYVVLKTRFSEKPALSKSLDTTFVVSKPKIDVGSASQAKNKIVLWIVDSGCSKHMTGDRSLLRNFIEKFMGTAKAMATACFTQNRSIIHTRCNKTPYELLRGQKPNVEYFHVFGSLCYPINDRDDLGKMKPKADIGVFIGYSETSRGFQIYNRRTKKIMETIHVKFDELTAMASEHDCLEPELQRFNNYNSSVETMNTSSIEDLDNLFGPMFEKYFEKKFSDTTINSAAQPTQFHEDSPSTYSIIIDEHEAPPIVTTFDEQTSPISLTEADEFNQEDSADFDGNS
ncbi:retrovirus-related pol polyprotein from transposon TNT 1-94, partial [Tanacetum coccineum]